MRHSSYHTPSLPSRIGRVLLVLLCSAGVLSGGEKTRLALAMLVVSAASVVNPPADPPADPVVLATGSFVDGEHATTGTATVLELPDGSRYLRLENFSTSDGPDVDVQSTLQKLVARTV